MPKRPDVFIEKMMPVQVLNEQVNFEHGGNPFKGLHRWYSRKPLSFSRASVLASLLPADITMQEFEYLLGLVPGKEVKLYKTPPNSVQIKKVQDYCEKVWGTRTPTVLDAFAGGGSIPFEAARYGFNVLVSDLNPVAVVTMKAAMEYPLKFGPDLQQDIDKWVKWVGNEAEKRLAEFFPSLPGETVQNYFWAHTVVCPSCESVVPLSPNWWLSRTSNYAGKGEARKITSDWYAVKPIPNPEIKRVYFELIKGRKGKGATIQTPDGEYNPDTTATISRGVGKCPNCGNVIDNEYISSPSQESKLSHHLYAVAYKKRKGSLEFITPRECDFKGIYLAELKLAEKSSQWEAFNLISHEPTPTNPQYSMIRNYGITEWMQCFNQRQLLTIITYVEIINDAKALMPTEYESEKVDAILTYLALILDRCADANCRLAHWDATRVSSKTASAQHALNLMWNYPEFNGAGELWSLCAEAVASNYAGVCSLLGTQQGSTAIPGIKIHNSKLIRIDAASADNLTAISDQSVDAIVIDPPYYGTIPYADLADFYYVWLKRTLGDIFPELFYLELTDKDREAVANPSRFRNMGVSPEKLANQDYEAKMAMAFAEYHCVLRDDGVMTVQFNHKDSGAWDVLAKSLIDAGFEITASLTQWYILAWDTFEAREFPFDEARQLALAVGGFDVSDLVKKHKLLDSASGYCKLLTPQQRLKKRAFSVTDTEFSARYLVDGLHAIIALYQEEDNTEPVRRFLKNTGLVSNDLFMRTFEVALKVIPRIGDEKKRIPEEKALLDLWLAMDEIKAKVSYVQPELSLNYGQMSLNLETDD